MPKRDISNEDLKRSQLPGRFGSVPLLNRVLALTLLAPPALMALVLGIMRPDLIQPQFERVYGYFMLMVIAFVLIAGMSVQLVLGSLTKSPAAAIGVWLAGLVLCSFPAVFLVMFGPIVFAFMFGSPEH